MTKTKDVNVEVICKNIYFDTGYNKTVAVGEILSVMPERAKILIEKGVCEYGG